MVVILLYFILLFNIAFVRLFKVVFHVFKTRVWLMVFNLIAVHDVLFISSLLPLLNTEP